MSRHTGAQKPFSLLVANLEGSSDPSKGTAGNPVKIRTKITEQHFPEVSVADYTVNADQRTPGVAVRQGLMAFTTPDTPIGATGSVTVTSNVFTAQATLRLGPYTLTSGVDYTVGGGVNATATNLAAAIDLFPDYTAVAVGAVVTITGPYGPDGNSKPFSAVYRGSVQNFTLSPSNGYLNSAEPIIGAIDNA